LERALDVASSGTAGTVLIGAESGAGKSRLVSEFAAKTRDRALVLIGGCVEVSAAALPYAPITALLRKLVRSPGAGEAYLAEFDLMARVAGLRLRDRWGGWNGELYTASSWRHVSVYERAS